VLTTLAAAQNSIPLLTESEVRRDRLSLAVLLPDGAPEKVRVQASAIDLGPAPRPGQVRVLSRAEVLKAIPKSPELANAFILPGSIRVTRFSRAITESDVRKTVGELGGIADPAGLTMLGSPLTGEPGDPRLNIDQATCDAASGRTLLRLTSAADPHLLPFLVSVEGCDLSKRLTRVRPEAARAAGAARARAGRPARREVWVKAGRPARMVSVGAAFRASFWVFPLENGARGEQIRVRVAGSRHVIAARVVGPGILQSD
jgi:hypothetical protein